MFKPDNFTILIVDDNPKNLQVLGTTLSNEKYNVEFATNGKAALDWLKEKEFDLVLLDVMMPEMDGFETCQVIRSDEELADMPVIFITAKADNKSVIEGFNIGAQDYVTKPFDSNELLSRVKTHLELKESKEKIKEVNKWLEEKVEERTYQLNEANADLSKANLALSKLDEAKTKFLNLIGHEIRTPLNGIVGSLEILKSESKDPEFDMFIEILDDSVTRLEGFAYDALLISQLEAEKYAFKPVKIDIKELQKEIENYARLMVGTDGISSDFDAKSSEFKLTGDRILLEKCKKNIIEQARLCKQSNECKLTLNTRISSSQYLFEVVCENSKLSEEILEDIFTAFNPIGDKADNNPGFGLLLSKLIAELHNGSLEVSNNDTGGVLFRLELNL